MLRRIFAAGLIALGLPMATPAAAEEITATVVAGHPPVFRWVRMISEAFIPAVQAELEGTEHSISFSEQYGGAVAGVGEELETVGIGLAELGTIQALFDPAKLAVQNVTYYTPFVSSDSDMINAIMHRLHQEDPRMQAAYTAENIVYLGGAIEIDDYLLMTKFPVNSLADLDGQKIAAPGAAINWLSGTGAVGVNGNLTTYYNELQTGVYDGVIVFASAALPGKLYEVAPYVTRMGLGAQFAGSLGANKDWYDGLPAEVQAALIAGADAADEWYSAELNAAVAASFEQMAAQGATITDASAEMRATWAEGMDNAAKTWAADLDARGIPGTEVLSLYMETARSMGAEPLRNWDQE
ncbi:MAG: C4-dicarboxylate TRAP transporter substrate-binding protein [Pseudomonadota bacterium]